MPLKKYKPTKHEMAINILRALYRSEIATDATGKPLGAGAKRHYNHLMRIPAQELEIQNGHAVEVVSKLRL